ncbi:hypothetical protein KCP78_17310 [Salmonella enterica subsp. enterica]|nr:hypothetical protein KCP78_17310 [Salmonella enterica subsp. enterica]
MPDHTQSLPALVLLIPNSTGIRRLAMTDANLVVSRRSALVIWQIPRCPVGITPLTLLAQDEIQQALPCRLYLTSRALTMWSELAEIRREISVI